MAANGVGTAQKALWIVALSALIGFAAVYVIRDRSDNAPSAAVTVPTADETATSSEASSGAMAAFVKKATPVPLPDITFQDTAGKDVTLSSFKGKTVLLNLWATWCQPCREEMPALNQLQQTLGSDKFEVVVLSLDRQGLDASRKFLDEVKAHDVKLYTDVTTKQGLALKLVGMPTTILINKDGLEVGRLAGPAKWDSEEAKKLIEAAMK
jgi:thiol-disulfide isomerase/thioredoxin